MISYVDAVKVEQKKHLGHEHTCDAVVYDLALECDRLRAEIVSNAEYMQRQFAQFLAKVNRGEDLFGSSPNTGSSAARDVVTDTAKLQTAERAFFAVYQATFGLPAIKALRAQIASHITLALGALFSEHCK